MKEEFPEIIRRWYAYQAKFKSVLDLYFTIVERKGLLANNAFLFLAQALEVYHGCNESLDSKVQLTAEFRARRQAILDTIEEKSEQAWVKKDLSNHKTLAQKIDEIFDLHREDLAEFVEDSNSFAETIRHTRNYYTHFNPDMKTKGKIAEGADLFQITLQMKTLIEVVVLKDLGIQGRPIERVIKGVKDMRFISV